MEHDVEQGAEQSGTTTEQHVEQDLGTDETTLKKAVQWKQQGKTYRQIEDGLGVPKSTLHRYLKRNVPDTKVEPISHVLEQNGEDDIEEREEPQDASQRPSLPSGTLVFEQGDLETIRSLIPKAHQPTYIAHLDVVSKRQRLTYRNNNGHNNNGYSTTSTSADEDLKRAKARTEDAYAEMLRDATMRERLGHGQKNDSELSRRLDRIENKLDKPQGDVLSTSVQLAKFFSDMAQPKGHGVDPGNYIQQGINMVKEVERNINNPSPKNQFDLQLEDMRQTGELDRDKLHWEITKFNQKQEDDRESTKQLYGLIGKVVDGPVSELTKSAGGAMARKIDGMVRPPTAPEQIDVPCPVCSKTFPVILGSKQVICPFCRTTLGLQQQQPTPQAPEQPKEPQPEQAPQETETTQEKPIDETPSVEVK